MIRQLYGAARKRKDAGNKNWSLVYKATKLLANVVSPLQQYFNMKSGIDKEHGIIVSLTTFSDR
ncbi:MAG: hypothetical protein K2K54_00820, partial [Lachnospiraceae bacterium]|nr:hypothetical protein [Lachnospiraceae bacterium]